MRFKLDVLKKIPKKLRSIPRRYVIATAVAIPVIVYGLIFLLDKSVAFSYAAGNACAGQLTLFPGIHKQSGDTSYEVEFLQPIKIGNFALASLKTCFIPHQPPKEGVIRVSASPFGGLIMRKTFAIKIAAPPVMQIAKLDKPLPSSKPLVLPLSETDHTFTYYVKADTGRARCDSQDEALTCNIAELKLAQGAVYVFEIQREFNKKLVSTVAKKEIKTLLATKIITSSIKPGETVYAKPRTIDIEFDKKVAKVTPKLYKVENNTRTAIPTSLKTDDKKIQVTVAEDLVRQLDYELILEGFEATDGSGLESAYTLGFKTSGGPKVVNVSVGTARVPMGATAVITFDQPLSESQDITKIVTVGGGAVLSARKGNQVFVSLANVPRCGSFSIKITNDLLSSYDISGGTAWNYGGRMICYSISTIGYSSRGRAITAYYFGNGPRTVIYTGAIHGNEISTKSLMTRWIDDLEANALNIPADKTVIVVPQLNPDGVASGSRVNARNIDLNRNFATSDWQKDITTVENQPFPGGGGESPMSEPETQAIASLVGRTRPALVLSYHSIGSVVAANQAGASSSLASTYAGLSGYRNATGQTGDVFEYAVTGTADDWYAERMGVASILIELGSHTSNQFSRNQKAMWAMLNS